MSGLARDTTWTRTYGEQPDWWLDPSVPRCDVCGISQEDASFSEDPWCGACGMCSRHCVKGDGCARLWDVVARFKRQPVLTVFEVWAVSQADAVGQVRGMVAAGEVRTSLGAQYPLGQRVAEVDYRFNLLPYCTFQARKNRRDYL